MENKEPSREGATEQEARSEKYNQEAEQLLKLHWQDKVIARKPTLLIAILTVYLFLVYTVATIGMLASSGHHDTTSEFFLVASILLLLPVPIGVIWYFLLISLRKKPLKKVEGKQSLLEKVIESPISAFLLRLSNNRFFKIFQYAGAAFNIEENIRHWPQSPRLSLTIIVFFLTFIFWLALWDVTRWYDKKIQRLWEFNDKTVDVITAIAHALDDHKDSILKSFDHLQDQNEFTKTSVLSVIDLFERMNQPASPPNQIDAAPKETQEQPKQLDAARPEEEKSD